MPAASLPAPGSVSANAPIVRPAVISGRYRFLCASVPYILMNWAARDWCATYTVLVAVHPRASSSATMAPWRAVPPLPPYASSMPNPNSPSSAKPSMLSAGKSPLWSYAEALGASTLSAKSRTVVRRSCSSSVIRRLSITALMEQYRFVVTTPRIRHNYENNPQRPQTRHCHESRPSPTFP